jgi:hypothetical protein
MQPENCTGLMRKILGDRMKITEITEQYNKRITQLLEKLQNNSNRSTAEGCFAGTLSIIETLYGKSSQQIKALFETRKILKETDLLGFSDIRPFSESIAGILRNIHEELNSNLIRNIANEAAGEVIGDLVALAKIELKAGFTNVASVLASAALEDALKRKAEQLGINTQNKTLETIINALKSKSFFKGAQVPIVTSYVRLRNAAMHADWDKIQDADVNSLIGFLEPFLIDNFT